MMPHTSCLLVLTLALFEVGTSQYTSPVFHRTFSDGCAAAKIKAQSDCPLVSGKNQWSREKRTAESDTRFKTTTDIGNQASQKCHSKVFVQTQTCNAVTKCVMTTYKYQLPRTPGNLPPSHCRNDWSIETKCKANGPGGKNTKSVHFNCFKRGSRSFCGVKFETCKPQQCFTWTGYRRQCFVECKTSRFSGVAMQFVRTCKECDGGKTDAARCPGGKAASTQIRRCVPRSKVKAKAPDCVMETTTLLTSTVKKPVPTTVTMATEPTTTTEEETTTSPTTTKPTTTKPRTTIPTTTFMETTTPEPTTTTPEPTTTTETTIETSTTTIPITTAKVTTTKTTTTSVPTTKLITTTTSTTDELSTTVLVFVSTGTKSQHEYVTNKTIKALPAGYNGRDEPFDLVTIAGGAGAGFIFIILIAIIIVLLVRRRESKSSPDSNFSSSSLYRSRSPKNPVVDSSSFRIATWIRERPALPKTSIASSDSGVSDAEYWKIGESSKEIADLSSQEKSSESDAPKIPDVVKTASVGRDEDHIYDEVAFGELDDMRTVIPRRITPKKSRRTSVNSSQSEPVGESIEWPPSESAVYAVVRKTRKRGLAPKKNSFDSSSNDIRRKVASEHSASVTRLNGRHLREGVLQIEFDEKEGMRCKLSDSDVYMNMQDIEPSPVI